MDRIARERKTPIAEARRMFLITVMIRAAFVLLAILAGAAIAPTSRLLAVAFIPTGAVLLLAMLTHMNKLLGPSYLMVPLLVDATFMSLRGAPSLFWTLVEGSSVEIQVASQALSEPFAFTLIPLVLVAWAYGRRGAFWGSLWITIVQSAIVGVTAYLLPSGRGMLIASAMPRIGMLWALPFIVSTLAQREQQQLTEVESAHRQLQRHAATVEQLATSRERNRMARDLHDTLAHSLAALTIHLGAVRTLIQHDPGAAKDAVAEARDMARDGLQEARDAIQALREDPVESLGLVEAVRADLEAFQIRTGVEAHLVQAGDQRDITGEEAAILYRIIDEALTNVERHASATLVTVRMANGFDRGEVAIEDNGLGFDPNAVSDDHYGILGMEERAKMIGATLTVETKPGGGTIVRCEVKHDNG